MRILDIGRGGVFWIAHVAYWSAVFAASILLRAVFHVDDPPAFGLTEVALCLVATAVMRRVFHQQALLERAGLSKIGVIAGGALASAVTVQLVLLATGPWFGVAKPPRAELVARLLITLGMVTNWCGFYFSYQLLRERNTEVNRALRAESAALRNELHRLQAQISPHFLFNALNTVMVCRNDPEAIAAVTQALANYLRFLLRPAATLEPLSRELDALEDYLTIQGMRFGDGLETRIDCDFDAREIPVPPVLVQPLVENAIKYGGQTAPRPIRVRVAVRREGEWLTVDVANAGRWVAPGGGQSTGTGLLSLQRRLQLLVDPAATVTHREEDGWVQVVIRMPVVHAAPADLSTGAAR